MRGISVFDVGIALLAFLIAFYALAARERRTPLIVNSIYYAFYVVFASLILAVIAAGLDAVGSAVLPAKVGDAVDLVAVFVLVVGLLLVLDRIWRLHNQHKNFRTDARFKNLAPVRRLRLWLLRTERKQTYTHNPTEFSNALLGAIGQCTHLPDDQTSAAIERARIAADYPHAMSAAFRVRTAAEADSVAAELACCFLADKAWVQYATCARHPIEFWSYLKSTWEASTHDELWAVAARRIVLVDAYTPHFGFTDSIHAKMTLRAEKGGGTVIPSDASFAGLHTATMQAFKKTKAAEGGDEGLRRPTLVVYEGVHALVELESLEQYRIFMRHMMPSERLWGSMFTLVLESSISHSDMSIVRSYADIFVDYGTGFPEDVIDD